MGKNILVTRNDNNYVECIVRNDRLYIYIEGNGEYFNLVLDKNGKIDREERSDGFGK